jgi:transposase, IS5 family
MTPTHDRSPKDDSAGPSEFGYKAQVVDNVDGIVVDHSLHIGNPPDASQLVPAIERVKARFGRAPRAVVADRGYGEAAVDAGLEQLGVHRVVIPRKGRPGTARQAVQRTPSFRKLVKWRTGSEARISCLKRDYGWRRTLTDGETGAATWCGWGVLAHNAAKISALTRDAERQRAGPVITRERPERAAA